MYFKQLINQIIKITEKIRFLNKVWKLLEQTVHTYCYVELVSLY